MKNAFRHRLILSALTLASWCASAALPAATVERGPRAKAPMPVETEARVIVKFKADSALMRALAVSSAPARPQHAQALSGRMGLSLRDGRVLGAQTQVIKGSGLTSKQLADRLAVQPDVESVEVDGRVRALVAPNDSLYAAGQTGTVPAVGQWYLRAPNSTTIQSSTSVLSSINAEAAWAITTGSASVIVAVLDTGIRADHPDLAGKLLPGYDFIADLPTALDNDARDADPSDPGDAGCGETTSSWHGTQTAGLIGAATNNGTGMAGVGRNVRVLPLRVLGCGGLGYNSDIQAAMLWAAGIHVDGVPDNTTPAKVLNLSLGGDGACGSYATIIQQVNAAGASVVAAAGNDGLDVGTPANCPGAIGVAGLRHSGTKVGYSDLGPTVSISAPAGNCVNAPGSPCLYPLLTTSNRGVTTPVAGAAGAIYTGTGDDATIGTSFSTPLVAGVLGLMYSANASLTPAQALAALKAGARPFPATGFDTTVKACVAPSATPQGSECYCTTTTCGAGMLDAAASVALVATTVANIAVASNTATVGSSVTFDGSASRPAGGLTYLWSIAPATGLATITSATNASSMTLQASAVGNLTVNLTVTDSTGKTATASTALAISTAPAPVPPSDSGGGGGGAMDLGWLLGWLASVIGVWAVTPRARRD